MGKMILCIGPFFRLSVPCFTTLFDPNFDHHHTIALLIRNTYRVIHIKGLKIIAYSSNFGSF